MEKSRSSAWMLVAVVRSIIENDGIKMDGMTIFEVLHYRFLYLKHFMSTWKYRYRPALKGGRVINPDDQSQGGHRIENVKVEYPMLFEF